MSKTEKANRARAILEDVLFTDAIEAIRGRHLSAFENSGPSQQQEREEAYWMLKSITQLTSQLHDAIDDEAMSRKVRKRGND